MPRSRRVQSSSPPSEPLVVLSPLPSSKQITMESRLHSNLRLKNVPDLNEEDCESENYVCDIDRCWNSAIIEHKDGNALNNNPSNLALLGYLAPGIHSLFPHKRSMLCRRSARMAPVLNSDEVSSLMESNRRTDLTGGKYYCVDMPVSSANRMKGASDKLRVMVHTLAADAMMQP